MALGDSVTDSERPEAALPFSPANDGPEGGALDLWASRAERARRELEALSYSISHDLRAPLRAIEGFSQALVADYGDSLPDEARQYVARIRRASERLSAQIDALLSLSRIHDAPLRPTRVDLSHLARKICSGLERQNPERDVSVQIEPDVIAFADAHLVGLMLGHLLENAWKFTRRQPRARIELLRNQTEAAGGWLIRDNGVGFNMAYAERLFAPFQRLHKESEFEGIGIGLAMVQRIASRHDGKVSVRAEPNAGATFSVVLGNQP